MWDPQRLQSLSQEVLSNLDSEENLLAVSMDQPSTSTQHQVQHPLLSVYQPSSVSSVPAPSVSMGVCSANLVVPEGTDTEKVTDMFVTVISEQTFHIDDQAVSSLCVFKLCLRPSEWGKEIGWTLNLENLGTVLLGHFVS